jgi:hypothetical protein
MNPLLIASSKTGSGADGITAQTGYFSGYMQEFRITSGVARYTTNFTVPTAAFPNQ